MKNIYLTLIACNRDVDFELKVPEDSPFKNPAVEAVKIHIPTTSGERLESSPAVVEALTNLHDALKDQLAVRKAQREERERSAAEGVVEN